MSIPNELVSLAIAKQDRWLNLDSDDVIAVIDIVLILIYDALIMILLDEIFR